MKIIVMDQDIFTGAYQPYLTCLEPLQALGAEIIAYPGTPVPSIEERYERIKDADVVMFGLFEIPITVLERLTKLKAVVFFGVGYQSFIDEPYCKMRGINIYNTPNYGCNTVSEYTIALTFALARKICDADRRMKNKTWIQDGLEGREIMGQVFGIAGTGAIGSLVAQKATLLGAKVIAHDPYPSIQLKEQFHVEYVSLEALFKNSDILSLHLPIDLSTNGIITNQLIENMKKGALFINTARALVMQNGYKTVLERIKDGTLGGAAIDVFMEEPICNYDDYDLENVIITPHIGYLTNNAMGNTLTIACEKILNFLAPNDAKY